MKVKGVRLKSTVLMNKYKGNKYKYSKPSLHVCINLLLKENTLRIRKGVVEKKNTLYNYNSSNSGVISFMEHLKQ